MAKVSNLTIIYYTCNNISHDFGHATRTQLRDAIGELPIISVSHKPMKFGKNIVVDLPRHHLSIYRQALIGAKAVTTKYIALCEDDVLYSPEHFKHRSSPGKFAYNMNVWNIQTWREPMFTQKPGGRKNLSQLICERDLFIEAMEERFAKYPDGKVNLGLWAEPGKYERQLGVTVREAEYFYTNPPNISYSHETALSFENLGTNKRLGEIRATEIPIWGTAKEAMEVYNGKN